MELQPWLIIVFVAAGCVLAILFGDDGEKK